MVCKHLSLLTSHEIYEYNSSFSSPPLELRPAHPNIVEALKNFTPRHLEKLKVSINVLQVVSGMIPIDLFVKK